MPDYPQQHWFCPKCGQQNQLNFKHCTECGTALPGQQSADPSQSSPKPKPTNYAAIGVAALGAVIVLFIALIIKNDSDRRHKDVRERLANLPPSAFATPQPAQYATPSVPSASGITMEGYDRIQTGMTYNQVVQILGKAGTELSRNEIGGHLTVMYQWQGDGIGNMNAMFQNGKLIQKAQFGLK